MMNTVKEKWPEIIEHLRVEHELSNVSFNTWIQPLKVYDVVDNTVFILVNMNASVEYIAKKYGKDMATMLFPNKTPFYVVTNKSEYKGASAILNKKMLSEFGRKYNINKVVVIPSSIHEMLILSADILELERMEELTKMVQDVNANEVLVREQLSDRAYILDI